MSGQASRWRPVAELTRWGAVKLAGRLHLVGVLLGGHERLPAGHWAITSPVRFLDPRTGTAVTASTGRFYLLREPIAGPWPDGARDLIGPAMTLWRIAGECPAKPIVGEELAEHVARLGLDRADPWPEVDAPGGGTA